MRDDSDLYQGDARRENKKEGFERNVDAKLTGLGSF